MVRHHLLDAFRPTARVIASLTAAPVQPRRVTTVVGAPPWRGSPAPGALPVTLPRPSELDETAEQLCHR